MPYGELITRFTTGGHDIFITCPAKSMHLEPYIIPTCREAGNYYFFDTAKEICLYERHNFMLPSQ